MRFVTALGFGVLAFISLTVQPTAARAQGCNLGSKDCVCPGYGKCFYKAGSRNWCEQKGAPYQWDPAAGSCVKHISKTKPPVTSGGVGGGSDDCGAGYVLVPERGCVKLGDPSGHAYGGGGGGASQ